MIRPLCNPFLSEKIVGVVQQHEYETVFLLRDKVVSGTSYSSSTGTLLSTR